MYKCSVCIQIVHSSHSAATGGRGVVCGVVCVCGEVWCVYFFSHGAVSVHLVSLQCILRRGVVYNNFLIHRSTDLDSRPSLIFVCVVYPVPQAKPGFVWTVGSECRLQPPSTNALRTSAKPQRLREQVHRYQSYRLVTLKSLLYP